jgi:hypothetical protein
MKNLFLTPILIFLHLPLSAQQEIQVPEGPFRNSIDWYIKTTLDSLNSSPSVKFNSFKELGAVVAVHFYNRSDSLEEADTLIDRDVHAITTRRHFRGRFNISMGSPYLKNFPSSFYFIRNGTAIVKNIFKDYDGPRQ